jgi:hypothetical protein
MILGTMLFQDAIIPTATKEPSYREKKNYLLHLWLTTSNELPKAAGAFPIIHFLIYLFIFGE